MKDKFRIESNYFIAGGQFDDQKFVTKPLAPIIRYMLDWHLDDVVKYCTNKHWKLTFE